MFDIQVVGFINVTFSDKKRMNPSLMPGSYMMNLALILGYVSLFWTQACSLLGK